MIDRLADRRGFTLVELLGALALAGVLMVGVLAVMPSIRRGVRSAGQVDTALTQRMMLEVIRMDLINSRTIAREADGWVLTGFAAMDPNTQQYEHLPAEIRYQTQRWPEGRSALIRIEKRLAGDLPTPPHRQVLSWSARQLRIEPLSQGQATETSGRPSARRAHDPQPISRRVRIAWHRWQPGPSTGQGPGAVTGSTAQTVEMFLW